MKIEKHRYNACIANYFSAQLLFFDGDLQKKPNIRKCMELPYQQTKAELWDGIANTLEDLFFLEAKVIAGITFKLTEDFNEALDVMPIENPHFKILRLLEEALLRDIHFIARHAKEFPQALLQCFWNSGWWYDCPEVAKYYIEPEEYWSNTLTWEKSALKLHNLLERWCMERAVVHPTTQWLRSLRPPSISLGTSQKAVLKGHTYSVNCVAFSPDGNLTVSCSELNFERLNYTLTNTIFIWDNHSGKPVNILKGHTNSIISVAFSPDGRTIVSGSADRTVRTWDAHSGQPLLTFKGHAWTVTSAVFSPDGKRIASGSIDRTVCVWDAYSGQIIHILKEHEDAINCVAFSPDGTRIVSGSNDETVRIWDTHSGQPIYTFKGHQWFVEGLAYSPDGKYIVSCGSTFGIFGIILVWDAHSGQIINTIKGPGPSFKSVAFSPDGKNIVSGSDNGTVRTWDAHSGQPLLTFKGHTDSVNSVAYSQDGKRIVSGSDDKTVRIWDPSIELPIHSLKGHFSNINSIAFSPDGKRIASGSIDRTVCVWDAHSGQILNTLKGHNSKVNIVVFSPNGKLIASGSLDNTICIWDAYSGQIIHTLKGHEAEVNCLAFSPNGKRIVSGSGSQENSILEPKDNTVRLWDIKSGKCLMTLYGHDYSVVSVAFNSKGTQIKSTSKDRSGASSFEAVHIWDAYSGRNIDDDIDLRYRRFSRRALKDNPLWMFVEDEVTIIKDNTKKKYIAWFNSELSNITTNPGFPIWAGNENEYIHLIQLEKGNRPVINQEYSSNNHSKSDSLLGIKKIVLMAKKIWDKK